MSGRLYVEHDEVESCAEILDQRLYFATIKAGIKVRLKNSFRTTYFCVDEELVYANVRGDFGPLNISCVYKYCYRLNDYLRKAKHGRRIVHYTCAHPDKKTNAACLMGLFCVNYLNFSPGDAWSRLEAVGPYRNFVDAAVVFCGFTISILDCLQAYSKALLHNLVNLDDFNYLEYDFHEQLGYGNINWLVPRKLLAFMGPDDNRYRGPPPALFLNYFLQNDVRTIVQLNGEKYSSSVFTEMGIQHFELRFPDGTPPPNDVLLAFLEIAESAPAAVGVHCMAGLGRTGTLIGAYIIKHYHVTAKEAIAWMRLCRPGSVMGPQQMWLQRVENWLWLMGENYRLSQYGNATAIPKHKYGIYSKVWSAERQRVISDARRHTGYSTGLPMFYAEF